MKYINKEETDSAIKFTWNESIVGNMSSTNHKVLVELLKSINEKQERNYRMIKKLDGKVDRITKELREVSKCLKCTQVNFGDCMDYLETILTKKDYSGNISN